MNEKLLEGVLLLVVGMAGVFVSLLFLTGLILAIRKVDEALNRRRIATYAAKVDAHQVDDQLNDELVAVLVAAAAATLKAPVAVRRLRLFDSRSDDAWTVTGRLNIMASHAIAKRKQTT